MWNAHCISSMVGSPKAFVVYAGDYFEPKNKGGSAFWASPFSSFSVVYSKRFGSPLRAVEVELLEPLP